MMKLQTSFTITMAVMFTIFVITIRNLSALPTRTSFISTTKVSRLNNQSTENYCTKYNFRTAFYTIRSVMMYKLGYELNSLKVNNENNNAN